MNKESAVKKTVAEHIKNFGEKPECIAWAPGRIEVVGNHTDYNAGTVLSAAIDKGHCFCISRSTRPGIHLFAADAGQRASFTTADNSKVPNIGSGNYVKGVFYFIQEFLGQPIDGLDCTSFGAVPLGAGLSSSAALEVSAAFAVLKILNVTVDKKEIARLCQKAEHQFAGTKCGLLDQFSSIFGRDHGLIHSDFRTLEVSPVPLPDDIEFLVVNPHVKHSLADSPYNERRERCEQAAAQLAKLLPHPVSALRDVSPEEFEALRSKIDPAAAKRAAHVVGEIDRVEKGRALLRNGDVAAFGNLLFDSHRSSIENFENSCPELDVVVEAARSAGAFGARLSGGGFGGSAIVMVRANQAKEISAKISEFCRARGLMPEILAVIPSAGAQLIGEA
ncbi:MAG: galactokinase [Kiritimatiellaceae bacterium]|nr:galactokinase [Kiritimatiellaceae bacterium]